MTREGAISYLRFLKKCLSTSGSDDNAYDIAINAIEKQIPMDMVIKHEEEGYFDFDNYYCPTCGAYLGNDNDGEYWDIHWCNQCGQRVKYDDNSAVPNDEEE